MSVLTAVTLTILSVYVPDLIHVTESSPGPTHFETKYVFSFTEWRNGGDADCLFVVQVWAISKVRIPITKQERD